MNFVINRYRVPIGQSTIVVPFASRGLNVIASGENVYLNVLSDLDEPNEEKWQLVCVRNATTFTAGSSADLYYLGSTVKEDLLGQEEVVNVFRMIPD